MRKFCSLFLYKLKIPFFTKIFPPFYCLEISVDNKEEDSSNAETSANSAFRCGNCIACFRVSDCEKCPNCLSKSGACLRRVCVQAGLNDPTTSQTNNNDSSGKQTKKDVTEQKKKLKKKEVGFLKNNPL